MTRRPPSPFLAAVVAGREWLTPRLARVTLAGDDLRALDVTQPASSVRVLLPSPGRPHELEMPTWDGNRFAGAEGRRPLIRTLTPRHLDREEGLLHLDVAVHGDGAASRWASTADSGTPAAVSGPARGYEPDPGTSELVLGGDETAYAAICSIVESVAADVAVFLEITTGPDRPPLPPHRRGRVEWISPSPSGPGQAVAEALGEIDLQPGDRLWAAGEAAAMQRLRRRLFDERGVLRTQAVIRGYWKHGRASEDDPGQPGG